MNGKRLDASRKFHSLDDIYYFGGQQEHEVKAIWAHSASSSKEIDLNVDEKVKIDGNHWDGIAKGGSQHKNGLFPAYKVEDVTRVADFPKYFDDR